MILFHVKLLLDIAYCLSGLACESVANNAVLCRVDNANTMENYIHTHTFAPLTFVRYLLYYLREAIIVLRHSVHTWDLITFVGAKSQKASTIRSVRFTSVTRPLFRFYHAEVPDYVTFPFESRVVSRTDGSDATRNMPTTFVREVPH